MKFLYWFYSGLCHQNLARTLMAGNAYYVVCARNTGIYAGVVFGAIITGLLYMSRRRAPTIFPGLFTLIILVLTSVPMLLDAGLSLINVWPSSNEIRLMTGLYFGFAISAFLSLVFFEILTRFSRLSGLQKVRLFDELWTLAIYILMPILLWAAVLFLSRIFFYVVAVSVFLSIWFGNLIVIMALIRKKTRENAVFAMGIAVFSAAAEMAIMASMQMLMSLYLKFSPL
ncbi:MAG: DUF2085 domain-containing protein [Actinobacteria bacterium]|nr:DUF2085 domain-containing protein [Actinomycetota bacterium]